MLGALVVLAAVIGVLCVERYVSERRWGAERRSLVAAVMARNVGEFASFEAVSAAQVVSRQPAPRRLRPEDEPNEHEMVGVNGN